jgi:O-Antigen ligase
MSLARRFRRPRFLLSGTITSLAGGYFAGVNPLFAAGFGALIVLFLVPWNLMFSLLSFFSVAQSAKTGTGGGVSLNGIVVAGLNFRPAMAVLGALAIRTLMSRTRRNRWRLPEYLLIGYAVILLISSLTQSPQLTKSLPTVGDIWFGVAAYLVVFWAISTAERLRVAARIFLVVILINALYGTLAAVAHLVVHTHFGISAQSAYGPGVFGLSYEHDIFASTCGAGAIMFYALWREPNDFFSARFSGLAFLACTLAMFLGLARAAWIGFGVAFILLIVMTRRSLRSRAQMGRTGGVLIAITLGGLLLAYILLSTPTGSATNNSSVIAGIKAKVGQLFNVNSGTGHARVSELKTAISDVKTSPLIGLGANTYGIHHPLIGSHQKNNYIGNVWLRALYETGIIGIGLLFGGIALVLWPNRTLMSSKLPIAPIARALTFGWIVLAFAYLGTDDTLYMWPWILLALVRASRVLAEQEHRWDRRTPMAWGSDENGNLIDEAGQPVAVAVRPGQLVMRDPRRRVRPAPRPYGA